MVVELTPGVVEVLRGQEECGAERSEQVCAGLGRRSAEFVPFELDRGDATALG